MLLCSSPEWKDEFTKVWELRPGESDARCFSAELLSLPRGDSNTAVGWRSRVEPAGTGSAWTGSACSECWAVMVRGIHDASSLDAELRFECVRVGLGLRRVEVGAFRLPPKAAGGSEAGNCIPVLGELVWGSCPGDRPMGMVLAVVRGVLLNVNVLGGRRRRGAWSLLFGGWVSKGRGVSVKVFEGVRWWRDAPITPAGVDRCGVEPKDVVLG